MRKPSPGLTVVELLVSLTIITILAAIFFPAIQTVREAARRTHCLNNLRQIGLAINDHTSIQGQFPNSYFNDVMTNPSYTSDSSWLTSIYHHFDSTSAEQLQSSDFSFSTEIDHLISRAPTQLLCPSNSTSTLIENCVRKFGGTGEVDCNVATCDYIGNGGGVNPSLEFTMKFGPIITVIKGYTHFQKVRSRDILDGDSTTLLAWEVSGDNFYKRRGALYMLTWREHKTINPASLFLDPESNPMLQIPFAGVNDSLSYIQGWTGNRIGRTRIFDSDGNPLIYTGDETAHFRTINTQNAAGSPFSFHPNGCNFVFIDGHSQFISDSVDPKIYIGLATAAGNELTQANF